MKSFDQSLKRLLQHDPGAFIAFGFGGARVRVLQAVPSVLPARGRDVDGAYLVSLGGPGDPELVLHIELFRRHQGVEELGIDIVEAQARLFRREGRLVVSHVWDLYGDADAPLREERRLTFGADGSTCVYQRINLRHLSADALLAEGAPALWALVALTRDGAARPAIERARDAIEGHVAWPLGERADHLAVLWFVAEAEGVPGRLMRAAISEEKLMESELYRSIFGKGKAMGEANGILAVLDARGISVSDTVRARILGCTDPALLDAWIRRAVVAPSAAAVLRAKPPAPARPARGSRAPSKRTAARSRRSG